MNKSLLTAEAIAQYPDKVLEVEFTFLKTMEPLSTRSFAK
jgi:hypothetical protein